MYDNNECQLPVTTNKKFATSFWMIRFSLLFKPPFHSLFSLSRMFKWRFRWKIGLNLTPLWCHSATFCYNRPKCLNQMIHLNPFFSVLTLFGWDRNKKYAIHIQREQAKLFGKFILPSSFLVKTFFEYQRFEIEINFATHTHNSFFFLTLVNKTNVTSHFLFL